MSILLAVVVVELHVADPAASRLDHFPRALAGEERVAGVHEEIEVRVVDLVDEREGLLRRSQGFAGEMLHAEANSVVGGRGGKLGYGVTIGAELLAIVTGRDVAGARAESLRLRQRLAHMGDHLVDVLVPETAAGIVVER